MIEYEDSGISWTNTHTATKNLIEFGDWNSPGKLDGQFKSMERIAMNKLVSTDGQQRISHIHAVSYTDIADVTNFESCKLFKSDKQLRRVVIQALFQDIGVLSERAKLKI